MASLTIRNLKEETKKRLRMRAAENGRSLEAEARDLLDRSVFERALPVPKTGLDMFRGIMAVAEKYGGIELELPKRGPMRSIPALGKTARRARRKG
jgi:antitoxin FitA